MRRIKQRWHCRRCNTIVDIEALPVTAMYCPKGHVMRQVEAVAA